MTISCSEAEGVKHKLPNSKASIEKISYCGKAVRQAVQERRGKKLRVGSERTNNGRRPCRATKGRQGIESRRCSLSLKYREPLCYRAA